MNEITTAVPTLKVMRLQKAELDIAKAGTLKTTGCLLGSSLCLPDSFGVIHVGETFTAYLGALNVSKRLMVTNLTVTAQLQTPSQRWHMASKTLDESNAAGGCELQPEQGIDAIVSRKLEEAGQHILRVEVGYGGTGGTMKSLRKFYRFQVSNPLVVSELAYRSGQSCFLSISLQNNGHESKGGLTISSVDFEATSGLISEKIVDSPPKTFTSKFREMSLTSKTKSENDRFPTGVDLFDHSQRLESGDSKQYLFKLIMRNAHLTSGSPVTGMAAGDELGKVVFRWHKACGEVGCMVSFPVMCRTLHSFLDVEDEEALPSMENRKEFAMHIQESSLSTDIATQALPRTAKSTYAASKNSAITDGTDRRIAANLTLPITVEPINPRKKLKIGIPFDIDFLVVNHSNQFMSAQLQFRFELMNGVSVCGPSFKNLEDIPGNGGNSKVTLRFIALSTGLLRLDGCCVVNLATGQTISQPPMLKILLAAE